MWVPADYCVRESVRAQALDDVGDGKFGGTCIGVRVHLQDV